MADASVVGPLGECHLGHELRPHPVSLHAARWRLERALVRGERIELLLERGEALLVEAGADVARVDEPSLAVVDAEQQPAEGVAAAARVGIAGDHELLATSALELDPCGGTARDIGCVGALADEAF